MKIEEKNKKDECVFNYQYELKILWYDKMIFFIEINILVKIFY